MPKSTLPRKHPNAVYRLCVSDADLQELIAELAQAYDENRLIGFDTETSGLALYGPEKGRVVGLCFSTAPHTGWYVPIRHEVAEGYLDPRQLNDSKVLDEVRPFLEGTYNLPENTAPRALLVGHNAKFDHQMMAMEGIVCSWAHDTFIMASMLGKWQNVKQMGLKELTEQFLGVKPLDIEEVGLDPAEEAAFEEAVRAYEENQAAENALAAQENRKPKRLKKPKKKKVEIAFHKHSIEDALDYAAADADHTLQLLNVLYPLLVSTLNHPQWGTTAYTNIEMPLLPVVASMEMTGVPIDVEFLEAVAVKAVRMKNRVEDATKRVIFDLCGEEWDLNINSIQQLQKLFLERLPNAGYAIQIPNEPGSDGPKRTDSGAISLDGSVLEEMAKQHPWVHGIVTYKALIKLHGSFLRKMADQAIEGRIYANFWQVGTETGRFSSSGPNMQQIPKDQHFYIEPMSDELWEKYAASNGLPVDQFQALVHERLHADDVDTPVDVPTWEAPDGTMFSLRVEDDVETIWETWVCRTRNGIKAKPGSYIVEADYSQIELRVFAGESKEPALLSAFETGEDVHSRTASVVFGVPVDQVTKKQRGSAKTINFGIIYGATAKRVSDSEGIPFREAELLVRNYFAALPAAKSWIERTKKTVVEQQKSMTHYGRVRNFQPLLSFGSNSGQGRIAMAEREGVNAIIQGTAADIMKIALIRLHRHLNQCFGEDAKLVMTVHDSIVLEVRDTISVPTIIEAIKIAMVANAQGALAEEQARLGLPFGVAGYPLIDIDVQVGESWGAGVEVETGAEVETPSAVQESHRAPVVWILEVLDEITVEQQETLAGFLEDKRDSESNATIKVLFHRDGSEPYIKSSVHTYALDFRDVVHLRRILGNCNLYQDPRALDAASVLAGVGDSAVFGG